MPLDSIPVFDAISRVTDANGEPVPGGRVYFYAAGTATPLTVYADKDLSVPLGTSVQLDSGGYPVSGGSTQTLIYTGTSAFKMTVKDADGVTLISHDNIPGAPAVSAQDETSLPETPVASKTSAYTVLTADEGHLINASPTVASFSVTLPNAVDAGDGFRIGVRHVGIGNTVTIVSVSSQSITRTGASTTAFALTGYGEGVWLVSDGAGWHVDTYTPPMMAGGLAYFKVADRLAVAPSAPTAGARYIISTTPTGTWSSLGFAAKDIAEANGNGGWIRYTPSAGYFAYVADEDLFTKFDGSNWEDQTGMGAPSSSSLQYIIAEHTVTDGSGGGTPTANTWTDRALTSTAANTLAGGAVGSNAITLPVGRFLISAQQAFYRTATASGDDARYEAQQRIAAGTAVIESINLYGVGNQNGGVWSGAGLTLTTQHGWTASDTWVINVTTAGTIKLQYYCNFATTDGLGKALAATGYAETFARVSVLSLASLQGPQGIQGIQGVDGLGAAYSYQWNTATIGDPGAGKVRVNDTTLSSVTEFAVSETDLNSSNIAAVIATWDDTTSTVRARIRIHELGTPTNFVVYSLTGAGTDQGSYWTFPVTHIASGGTILNNDTLAVSVLEKGDKGDTGTAGTTVPDISGLTQDATPDRANDFLITYDTSAAGHKKATPNAVLGGNLVALAGLTSSADTLPYFTGSGTATTTSLSSFMRTLLDDPDATTARGTLGIGALSYNAGECRLSYSSATSILLNRYKGRSLFINGNIETVPFGGVSLSNSGLSASTKYYIYAYMSGATMTLEASTSAPSTDSTYGHQVKGVGGGETRSLVGRVITNGSGQFFGGNWSTAQGVVSWHNPERAFRVEQMLIGSVPGAGIDVPDNSGTYGWIAALTANTLPAVQFVGTARIKYARWRCIMSSNNSSNRARLVHFDDGPANLTQIAEVISDGSGNPVNSATDVTSTLQALQDGILDKNLGVQFASINSTTFTVYKQALELVYDLDAW